MESKEKINDIIILIILLTYLKPFNITLIPVLNSIYSLVKISVTVVLIIDVIQDGVSFTKASKWCLFFLIWWTISIIANGSIENNFHELLSIFGILLLFNVIRKRTNGLNIVARYLGGIAKVYIVLQFYTILVDHPIMAEPVISYDKYFLGSDNYSAFILIPLSAFIVADSFINDGEIKKYNYIYFVIAFLCLFIPRSWAGFFSYGAFLFMMFFRRLDFVKRFINVKTAIFVNILFLVLVVVFNIQVYFEDILNMIGKTGLSSREIIWVKALEATIKKPILGYGALTDSQVSSYVLYGTTHTHNIVLEFLMDSGLIGTFFASMWFKTAVEVKDTVSNNEVIAGLLCCITSYLLCSIFDFYITLIYFWILIIFFDCLNNELSEKEQTGNVV